MTLLLSWAVPHPARAHSGEYNAWVGDVAVLLWPRSRFPQVRAAGSGAPSERWAAWWLKAWRWVCPRSHHICVFLLAGLGATSHQSPLGGVGTAGVLVTPVPSRVPEPAGLGSQPLAAADHRQCKCFV